MDEQKLIGRRERALEARRHIGYGRPKMGRSIDPTVSERQIHTYETVEAPPNYLRQLAQITGVRHHWLRTGEGEMLEPVEPSQIAELRGHLEGLEDTVAAGLERIEARLTELRLAIDERDRREAVQRS